MKNNRFIKKVLLVIAFLLALNVVLTLLYNSPDSYAAKNIEYKVVSLGKIKPVELKLINITHEEYSKLNIGEMVEKLINAYTKEGWEFVEFEGAGVILIFKR